MAKPQKDDDVPVRRARERFEKAVDAAMRTLPMHKTKTTPSRAKSAIRKTAKSA
jgi:hypothetical protein